MKNKIIKYCGYFCILLSTACTQPQPRPICSGEIWPDNQGVHINAHGGGMLYHEGTYYWYGEPITGTERTNRTRPARLW